MKTDEMLICAKCMTNVRVNHATYDSLGKERKNSKLFYKFCMNSSKAVTRCDQHSLQD